MWDRSHPGHDLPSLGRRLGRVGRRRLGDPEAGLDVERPSCGGIAYLLQVSQTE